MQQHRWTKMSGEDNVAANDRGNDVADPWSSEKSREELLREDLAKYALEAVETAISECAATILQKRTADQSRGPTPQTPECPEPVSIISKRLAYSVARVFLQSCGDVGPSAVRTPLYIGASCASKSVII